MKSGFPIIFGGGIGDCFLVLGRFPIRWLVHIGIPCNLIYTTPGHPAETPVKQFCEKMRGCRFMTAEPTPMEKRLNQKWLAFSGRFRWIFAPPVKGLVRKRHQQPSVAQQTLRIGLHTHLDGHHNARNAWAKSWHPENWIQFISFLKSKHQCELFLMEWNPEAARQLQDAHPDMINLVHLDLVCLCQEISNLDVLVSVDSWGKYVARWAGIQQVVILPDLRRGYTPAFEKSTAAGVLSWFFYGLHLHPTVDVVGVEKQGGQWIWELNHIDDLAPAQLLAVFDRAAARALAAI
jgi:hypothetical protein